jgi:hypothetical protein
MSVPDFFDEEDEPVPEWGEEAETWRPPARCPQCMSAQTRFLTMNYEMSVYECDVCGIQFEVEE